MSPADVRAAREALGLTTRQFADRLRCTQRWVQMWEAGTRPIPGIAAVAIEGVMAKAPAFRRRRPASILCNPAR
jgi:DNA-binding transcriptional regulator YiaG